MKIVGMTLGGLLAGVLIGGCCYFICILAHVNLIWAYLIASAIDVAGFILLYKRYEQKVDEPESSPTSENKVDETVPKEESLPNEKLEEELV